MALLLDAGKKQGSFVSMGHGFGKTWNSSFGGQFDVYVHMDRDPSGICTFAIKPRQEASGDPYDRCGEHPLQTEIRSIIPYQQEEPADQLPAAHINMESGAQAEQECDFEGRSTTGLEELPGDSLEACLQSDWLRHNLVYAGLEGAGPHLASLTATVHFSAGPDHEVARLAGPLEEGEDGRVYAAVQFPSLRELWPEVYHTRGIRVVQVNAFVEIRTGFRTIRHPGTEFKVIYRRSRTPADDVVLWRPQDTPHIIRRRSPSS